MNKKMNQLFLLVTGVSFVLIGLNTFHDPLAAMAPVELAINTVSAMNELRANYGGLQIGLGLLLLAGVFRAALTRPALLAQALIVGGLACGRLISIALDGLPNNFIQSLVVLESVIALTSLALYCRSSTSPQQGA